MTESLTKSDNKQKSVANKFGLAQLHQLRGRVGRSGIQAHAWLFYPDLNKINDAEIFPWLKK